MSTSLTSWETSACYRVNSNRGARTDGYSGFENGDLLSRQGTGMQFWTVCGIVWPSPPHYIPHRHVPLPPFLPHSPELRRLRFHVVVYPDVPLCGVLPVQASRVLLQGPLPRNWHREHKGIQRWVVESLADEPAGGEYDQGGGIIQRAKIGQDGRAAQARRDDPGTGRGRCNRSSGAGTCATTLIAGCG